MLKEVNDLRAVQDIGSAILIKRASGKYSLFLPCTNIPATGSAPDQVETTVTTSKTKTYTEGRKDNPQKELTFYAHRDNFMKLKEIVNEVHDFIQINPDMTAWAYTGKVSFYQDETTVNNNIQAKATITVLSAEDTPRDDVSDLIEDIVTFPNAIPAEVKLSTSGERELNISTDPSDATITAESLTESVATATVAGNKLTINAVSAGTSIIKVKGTKTGCADNFTTILVTVA